MVGSHTIISSKILEKSINDFSFLKHEEWFCVDCLFENSHSKFILSHYKGYPFEKWEDEKYFILFEGMIYNFSETKIELSLKQIAEQFCSSLDFANNIKNFVENSDGDYIVQIYDKYNHRYILFNDYLGRLPIYFFSNRDLILISREIKFILQFIPSIRFNKKGIVENLMFEYTLGDKTIFDGIIRLNPCEYILCEEKHYYIFRRGETTQFNFKLEKNHYKNRRQSIQDLVSEFLNSTENRINKLKEKKYKIISDLSGGYDSRTLIGGLSKYDNNIKYYTFEYIQDESEVALRLFKTLNSPGNYIKINFKNEVDFQNISELVYKTDGLVNYYTTAICYNDIKQLRVNYTSGEIGHFAGVGGEFIRHPEKKKCFSLVNGIKSNVYSRLSFKEACLMVNLDSKEYINHLKDYLNSYKESKKSDILKHFYYEYNRNLLVVGGEERERIFHWFLQPLYSKRFIEIFLHQIPLKWINFKYFIDFMKVIDSRLLKIPIYKSEINLESIHSINNFDKKYFGHIGLKFWLKNIIKDKFSILIPIYRKIKNDTELKKENTKTFRIFYEYYNKLNNTKPLFDLDFIKLNIDKAGGEANRVTTLAMYLSEIEKKYEEKINI